MRLLVTALALFALVAPQAAQANGIDFARPLAQRDSLIHGIAGDERLRLRHRARHRRQHRRSARRRARPLHRPRGGGAARARRAGSSSRSPLGFRRPGTSSCSTRAASRRRARRRSTTTATQRPARLQGRARAHGRLRGQPLAFAEDVEVLPNGEYVVSESVFGGLWLIGRDGDRSARASSTSIRGSQPLPNLSGCPFLRRRRASGSAACRSPAGRLRARRRLARRARQRAVSELDLPRRRAEGEDQDAARQLAPGRRARRGDQDGRRRASPRPVESLKGITFNEFDRGDPWIYAGDPFRLQLIRIHSRTGKREVLSTQRAAVRLHGLDRRSCRPCSRASRTRS